MYINILYLGKIEVMNYMYVTKFFMLATKSWKLVAKLATRISYHTLPWNLVIVEEDKSAVKFLVKLVSKMQHMHDFEHKAIVTRRDLGFR